MKKLLTLTLSAALLLSLAACSQIPANNATEEEPTNAPQTVVTNPEITEPEVTEPETTQPAETEPTETPETTKKPETTKAPETTKKPTTTKKPATTTKPAHTHSYTTSTKKATCTANGKKTYTCSCGHTYSETLKATGHKWGDWNLHSLPSTTANGQDLRTCSVCSAQETKANGKLLSNNCFSNANNVVYETGNVTIRPRALYWSEDGYLYAECFVINGRNNTVSNIKVNQLDFSSNNVTFADGNFGVLGNMTIAANSYDVWLFRFEGNAVKNFGADLNYVNCHFNVDYKNI